MASARSVAIVHFTAAPAVGGIESMIDAQARGLRAVGASVRLVTGAPASDPDAFVLPLLHPHHPRIVETRDWDHRDSIRDESLVTEI
jgi:hypothetical protein